MSEKVILEKFISLVIYKVFIVKIFYKNFKSLKNKNYVHFFFSNKDRELSSDCNYCYGHTMD